MELATAPTEITYIPGNPGAAWTGQEVSVTRLRILEMLRPELDTQKIQVQVRAEGLSDPALPYKTVKTEVQP